MNKSVVIDRRANMLTVKMNPTAEKKLREKAKALAVSMQNLIDVVFDVVTDQTVDDLRAALSQVDEWKQTLKVANKTVAEQMASYKAARETFKMAKAAEMTYLSAAKRKQIGGQGARQ